MPAPRTLTITGAGALVRTKVNNVVANLNEGGTTEEARRNITRYFASRQALSMVGNILADATTETPTDVRAVFEADMTLLLTEAVYAAAI